MPPGDPSPPTVAVLMVTYDNAQYVDQAIGSVLAQTYTEWELFIVDDGSTDDTVALARRCNDRRIQVIELEHRGLDGLAESYRAALDRSAAPLVAILDGDDRWPAEKLARQVPDFDDPHVVLSYGAGELIDEYDCSYARARPHFTRSARTNRPTGVIIPSLSLVNPILSPTVVVRRSALEAIGGFWQLPGVPYVDHPTWLRLAEIGAFAWHAEVVGCWRRHSAQWTTRVVASEVGWIPERDYIGLIASRHLGVAGAGATGSATDALARPHLERALLNRWRLALLSGSWRDVRISFVQLVRSGRPRLVGLALLGLVLRTLGSDLEWIQRSRQSVSWPSRRHMRRHAGAGTGEHRAQPTK